MSGAVLDRIKSKTEWLDGKMEGLDINKPGCRHMAEAGREAREFGAEMLRRAERDAPGFTEEEIGPLADRFDAMLGKIGEAANEMVKSVH